MLDWLIEKGVDPYGKTRSQDGQLWLEAFFMDILIVFGLYWKVGVICFFFKTFDLVCVFLNLHEEIGYALWLIRT